MSRDGFPPPLSGELSHHVCSLPNRGLKEDSPCVITALPENDNGIAASCARSWGLVASTCLSRGLPRDSTHMGHRRVGAGYMSRAL